MPEMFAVGLVSEIIFPWVISCGDQTAVEVEVVPILHGRQVVQVHS